MIIFTAFVFNCWWYEGAK